ncbi:GNAT family N-acetyltransferase [Rudaeicoccus suwonensis]|uniref:Putative acetyltransferase n=1 Tax=Rudaeicoccus suwonensis TaxID=657409 RepID=A0A561DVG0_9MICO|nr:GNAT family N-acetyltransferase [Rudaeicoccus suwonensis]TWE07330.1 putative acetyltransferase [Rudaeicoccus suwonensis]
MTTPSVTVADADPIRALRTEQLVWFGEEDPRPVQTLIDLAPAELVAASIADEPDQGAYQGVYGVWPLQVTVPGPVALDVAGLTWVGVHPDHRRKGILTAMLRDHFERVHADPALHLSVLQASEPAIYGRHGYGMAGTELAVSLGRGTTLTAPGLEPDAERIRTSLVTIRDGNIAERLQLLEKRIAATQLASVVGDARFYRDVTTQSPEDLRGTERTQALFAQVDGEDVGVATFDRKHKWELGRPAGELTVHRLIGTPAARFALLRRLVDFDLMSTIRLQCADQLVVDWVGGPRRTSSLTTLDGIWFRLVDLAEGLAQRRYATSCDVVVDVTDKACPWNAGTWRITTTADGSAETTRSGQEPDIHLDVAALGAAYLGAGSLVTMLRAGLISEKTPGAVHRLWGAMRSDEPLVAGRGF